MRKRLEVKAVWNSDLEHLLSNLGILDAVLLGKFNCAQCGRLIDLDNVGAILPQKDKVTIVCDYGPCVHTLTRPEVPSSDE